MPLLLPKISAVSYLNTVPLIWGMKNGRQSTQCSLEFCLPSQCADHIENGSADLGIVPVIEVHRQGLEMMPGCGIACQGPVRTILLVSRVAPEEIRTLATDVGSRTSVMLSRVILHHLHGADPQMISMTPDLDAMLQAADAALIIGDAALAIQPETLPYFVQDLGQRWVEWTGLPMVFAVWAGRPERVRQLREAGFQQTLLDSLACGLSEIDRIVQDESRERGFSPEVVRHYLTRNVAFDLGERENKGMRKYLELAGALDVERTREAVQR